MAAVRAEVAKWTYGDSVDDPGEVLLRLITQSRIRVEMLGDEIQRQISEAQDLYGDEFTLEAVLIGDSFIATSAGAQKTGEYTRGIVRLEADERNRLADFCFKALNAKLGERQVRLAEKQGDLLALLMSDIRDDPELGLTRAQRIALPAVVRRHVQLAFTPDADGSER